MSHIARIDPSFLRHGALIDLNDLRTDDLIERYKDLYFDQLPRQRGERATPFFQVDHLIRTEPDNYQVVPQGPWSVGEARELGLLIDTRHIARVHRSGTGPLRITDLAYEALYTLGTHAFSGTQLMRYTRPAQGSRNLRPHHHYIDLNSLAHFAAARAVRKFPRPRSFLDHQHLFETMMHSKTLHEFAVPVFLLQEGKPGEEPRRLVFVDVNLKRLDAWLRRHQSSFYQSAARHQKVLDDMEDALDTRHLQAQADDAKAPVELTALEADALGILDEGELEDEEDAPDETFLPTPASGQRTDEEL